MPTVRVFLECSSPTRRPSGLFDTFVAVSGEGLAAGEHLRIASRRAAILGYGGPHVVREVRRLDAVTVGELDRRAVLLVDAPDARADRHAARVARLMAEVESEAMRALRSQDAEHHPTLPSPRRPSTRRGRAPIG